MQDSHASAPIFDAPCFWSLMNEYIKQLTEMGLSLQLQHAYCTANILVIQLLYNGQLVFINSLEWICLFIFNLTFSITCPSAAGTTLLMQMPQGFSVMKSSKLNGLLPLATSDVFHSNSLCKTCQLI